MGVFEDVGMFSVCCFLLLCLPICSLFFFLTFSVHVFILAPLPAEATTWERHLIEI